MRLLGLDIGKKRIGVALSDECQILATPYKMIDATKGFLHVISELKKIIETYHIAKIIVGYPLDVNDRVTESTTLVEKYIGKITHHFPHISIVKVDERYSTLQAIEQLSYNKKKAKQKRMKVIDTFAATVILQRYIDNKDA